eukprot:1036354_1
MSLTKAVHFRELITQLTNEERVGFLSQLIDSHVNMILTCLFQHLSKPNQMAHVDDFNQSILDIIQARKDKPKQLCSRDIQFDQFPRAIIGYTASFLDQSDYVKLSVSNRSIYLGCNLPNTLHEIDLTRLKTKNYSSVTVAQFQSIKSLCIDPYQAIKSQHNLRFESPHFNQVTTLELSTRHKTGWVEPFLNQNIINCDHITTLKCHSRGPPNQLMGRYEVLSLLAGFPNLTHLDMHGFLLADTVTGQDIVGACPKVVAFTYRYRGFGSGMAGAMPSDLLKLFASQLKYLDLRAGFSCDNAVFSQLEELCFGGFGKSLNNILKYAFNLRKMYVSTGSLNIETIIVHSMVKCKFLNYIGLSGSPTSIYSFLDGIECGLNKTKAQQRKQFKICVEFQEFKVNDFISNIRRVVKALDASNIRDFQFICTLSHSMSAHYWNLFRHLRNLSTHTKVIRVRKSFIISNENSKLNENDCIETVCGRVVSV